MGSDLISRLERLEQQYQHLIAVNLRMKAFGGVVLVGAVALALLGANQEKHPGIVEASRFVLRDKGGQMRALLDVKPDGTPILAMYDLEGKNRLTLDMHKDGGANLNIFGKDGVNRSTWAAAEDGSTSLSFYGRDGKDRAVVGLWPDGSTALGLYDQHGKARVGISVMEEGPRLDLLDHDGIERLSAQIARDGTPSLIIKDEKGKSVFQQPMP